jgi:hypothetical protein
MSAALKFILFSVVLAGKAKKTQAKDIRIAHTLWMEYKQAKAKKK